MENKFNINKTDYYIQDAQIIELQTKKPSSSQKAIAFAYLKEKGIKFDPNEETSQTATMKITEYFSLLEQASDIEYLINNLVISKETLNQAEIDARNDWWYGSNQDILEDIHSKHPSNKTDSDYGISKKVKYLDSFYSTHLRTLGKKYVELTVSKIMSIEDFDQRLTKGDNSLVTELMYIVPSKREFSFATKYCALHNPTFYYIFDSVNTKILPRLFKAIALSDEMKTKPIRKEMLLHHSKNMNRWISNKDYDSYNNAITDLLGDLAQSVDNAKRKLDWLLWYKFKDLV